MVGQANDADRYPEARMTCCTAINADTGRFFSYFAGLHRLRHRWLGFERTQRQLLEGLRLGGIAGAELLEIGCGLGYLHRVLLQEGASRAVGVDLSARMIALARQEAEANGLAGRTRYHQGDFTLIADRLSDADVTILDKVICCYPDWQGLVDRSAAKTRRLYAFTIPRDRALARIGLGTMRWGLNRAGCCYRPFVHDPAMIAERLAANGFRRIHEACTATWVTPIYARQASVSE
jgi:magnesium-protoporphyrin O-methyltransferase